MKLKILIILLIFPALSFSQEKVDTFIVGTRLIDKFTHEPVFGAKVELLNATDSSLVNVVKMQKGDYYRKPAAMASVCITHPGKYLVRCSKQGYETTYNELNIKRLYKRERYIDRYAQPFLIKKESSKHDIQMGEIVVKATKVKFYSNGDTLVYNADAFELAEGSMLDALIRQMQGVELKRGGEIFVNGRRVNELLLNGKNFFDKNRQLLLDNLPAYMVKDVKVYEHKDEMMNKLYGDRNNQKSFVMDIKLKREYNIGWVSNAEGGIGTDNRFLGRLFALRITPHSQLSIYANANNLNDDRQPGNNGEWSPLQQMRGIMDCYTGGANYNIDEKNRKYSLSGNIGITYTEQDNRLYSNTENYLNDNNTYGRSVTYSNADNFNITTRHSWRFLPKYAYFSITPNFTYSNNHNRSELYAATLFQDMFGQMGKNWIDSISHPQAGNLLRTYALNRTLTNAKSNGKDFHGGINIGATLPLPHDNSKSISFSGGYDASDNKQYIYEHYLLQYPSLANEADDYRNRYNFNHNHEYKYYFGVAPRFYLSQKTSTFVELNYSYTKHYQNSNRSLYLLHKIDGWGEGTSYTLGDLPSVDELLPSLDTGNSNNARCTDHIHIVDLCYKLKTNKHIEAEIHLPLRFENNKFAYQRDAIDTLMHRDLTFFEPSAWLSYVKWPQLNIYLKYTYSSEAPSMVYLVNFKDDSNPLNIFQGTSHLKNRHTHHLEARLNRQLQGQKMYNLNGSFNHHRNSLALGYSYNMKNGVRVITPQNVNGNWDAHIGGGYTSPLDSARHITLSSNTSLDYYNSTDIINALQNTVRSFYANETLKLAYNPRSGIQVCAVGAIHYLHSQTVRNILNRINAYDFNYGLTAQADLPLGFQIATDVTMYYRRGYVDSSMNTNEVVWNARLSKRFLHGALVCMLDGFDLLGQLSNIRRTINAQGRVETWSNVTPRYAMLHVVYRFNKQPKK